MLQKPTTLIIGMYTILAIGANCGSLGLKSSRSRSGRKPNKACKVFPSQLVVDSITLRALCVGAEMIRPIFF